jgi:hypothetical protein
MYLLVCHLIVVNVLYRFLIQSLHLVMYRFLGYKLKTETMYRFPGYTECLYRFYVVSVLHQFIKSI